MKRIISFLVVNEIGVLNRVSGLLSKRGFNVESITAGVTENESLTRITLMLEADDRVVEQMIKQLDKLLVVKVNIESHDNKEFIDDITEHKGVIVDLGNDTATVQFFGSFEYINICVKYLGKYNIVEVARTGIVALDSGDGRL